MTARKRKITRKNPNDSREPLRFAPGDVVRAIEEVEAAGLRIYGVKITLNPPSVSKRPATPRQEAERVDETTPVKKQA